jgi:hypothetical protein
VGLHRKKQIAQAICFFLIEQIKKRIKTQKFIFVRPPAGPLFTFLALPGEKRAGRTQSAVFDYKKKIMRFVCLR